MLVAELDHKTDWEQSDPVASSDFNRIEENIKDHAANKDNPHGVAKAQIVLGNVENKKQIPIAGGTFTGIVAAQNNTAYTTKQSRSIILSTEGPSSGASGDIWLKFY